MDGDGSRSTGEGPGIWSFSAWDSLGLRMSISFCSGCPTFPKPLHPISAEGWAFGDFSGELDQEQAVIGALARVRPDVWGLAISPG